MSYQNETIGMMDEGYFVPRGEIFNWLNSLLELNLTKIQQLGSGAVYCQVLDVIHPGKVALNKVNWKAKNDYEFIANLRILQNAFDKIGIKRYVEVQKLAKARYQDNLQFIQWLKRYYDLNCGDRGSSYQGQERRGGAAIDFSFADKNVVPKTYNGTGVIIPKKDFSPPRKKQGAVEPQPKKITTTTSVTTNTKTNPRQSTQSKPKKQKQESKIKQDDRQEEYLARVKQLQQKLAMIGEILRSEDTAQLKVNLITQIVEEGESESA